MEAHEISSKKNFLNQMIASKTENDSELISVSVFNVSDYRFQFPSFVKIVK